MLTYNQSTGNLYTAAGELLGTGYSGAGSGKNRPEAEAVHDVGPIPDGMYVIGEPEETLTHGPYAMRLYPDPGNEMHQRSGFLIHGDSIAHPGSASEGCVILPRAVREAIWSGVDHVLLVVPGVSAPQPE